MEGGARQKIINNIHMGRGRGSLIGSREGSSKKSGLVQKSGKKMGRIHPRLLLTVRMEKNDQRLRKKTDFDRHGRGPDLASVQIITRREKNVSCQEN